MWRRIYALWAKDPAIFYDVNVTGTKNLLKRPARSAPNGSSTAAPSARSAFRPRRARHGRDARLARTDGGHYKRSKYLAEQEVLKLAKAGLRRLSL